MNKQIVFHNDPGHGWYAAPMSELIRLRINNIISGCSYISGETVYLEEDCDASTYFDALEESGQDMKQIAVINRYAENCFVRSLRPYPESMDFETHSKMNYDLAKWREYEAKAYESHEPA